MCKNTERAWYCILLCSFEIIPLIPRIQLHKAIHINDEPFHNHLNKILHKIKIIINLACCTVTKLTAMPFIIRQLHFFKLQVALISIYGDCRKNSSEAARLHAQRYSTRRHPTDIIFKRLKNDLRENWPNRTKFRWRVATNEENEIVFLQFLHGKPQSLVSRIIKENKFHPYHTTLIE